MPVAAQQRAAPAQHTRLELADIFSSHADAYCKSHYVTPSERRVLRAVMDCRTAALGGHREWCPGCGYERYRYHSCRNRHCPKCQTLAKASWLQKRQQELLPVPYFHNVFTLPHELNRLILASERNRRALLDLLFQAAAQTLLAFGENNLGGKVGFTMVLHTWDQQLRPHFHVHCVIAAGALSEDGSKWNRGRQELPVPSASLEQGLSREIPGRAGAADWPRQARPADAPGRVEFPGSPAPLATHATQKILERVLESPVRWTAETAGLSGTLYASCGDLQSSLTGVRERTSSLCVSRPGGRRSPRRRRRCPSKHSLAGSCCMCCRQGSCESGITDSWPIAPSRPAWPNAANSCTPRRQNRSNRKRWPIG